MSQPPTLQSTIHRGLRWSLARQGVTAVTGTIGAVAYSRFLLPEDLGAVTLAMLVYSGLVLLVEAPIRDAVIYYRDGERAHGSAAFWLLLGFATLALGAAALGAGSFARFYDSPIAAPLTRAVAVAFFFQALAVVPGALLLKHFRFGLHEGLQTAIGLFSMIAWALLAANGWGAWSLILPSVVVSAFWAAATWLATGFRPLLHPGRAAWRDILRFSRSLSASQLVTYLQANLDQAAVGTLGQAALGWYSFGESQSAYAVIGLGTPVAAVTLPAMAAVRERLAGVGEAMAAIRGIYLDMLRLAATLSTPMQIGTIILADLGVRVLFGEQWLGSVPVLRAYLTFRLVHVLLALSDATASATGRPDVRFAVQIAQLPFFAAGTWFGLRVVGGVAGVAWSLATVRTVAGLAYLAITLRLTRTQISTLLHFLIPSTVASAAMGLLVYAVRASGLVRSLLAPVGDARIVDGADLLTLTLLGVAIYFPLLFLLDPPGSKAILATARQVILPGLRRTARRGPRHRGTQTLSLPPSIDADPSHSAEEK